MNKACFTGITEQTIYHCLETIVCDVVLTIVTEKLQKSFWEQFFF
jgi:hypothetical protein